MHDANSYDCPQRTVVYESDDHGQEDFFKAADEPEIFGNGLVTGPDEVYGRDEACITHPFRFNHFLSSFQEQQSEQHYFTCQEDSWEESSGCCKIGAEGQIANLSENINVDLDQGEIEENDEEVEPKYIVYFVDCAV